MALLEVVEMGAWRGAERGSSEGFFYALLCCAGGGGRGGFSAVELVGAGLE